MSITMDGDGAWPDLAEREVVLAPVRAVAALPAGMESGKPSVSFRIDLPDGKTVIAETSMSLFQSAARAFAIRYEGQF